MNEVERRLDKLEEGFSKIATNQTRTNVLLEQVMDWVKKERSNSIRISVLENNWKWTKGIIGMLVIPVIFLLIKTFI